MTDMCHVLCQVEEAEMDTSNVQSAMKELAEAQSKAKDDQLLRYFFAATSGASIMRRSHCAITPSIDKCPSLIRAA